MQFMILSQVSNITEGKNLLDDHRKNFVNLNFVNKENRVAFFPVAIWGLQHLILFLLITCSTACAKSCP